MVSARPLGVRVPGRPPPHDRLRDRMRRRLRALGAYTGVRHWLLVRGTPLFVVFALLYVVNGLVIGWKTTYDVTIGITSPGDRDVPVPVLAWFLSVCGWLAAPAVFGAVAGAVVSVAISGRRQRSIREALSRDEPA
ncbi:DUF6313 family protein [Couchioplanes caeruleus]|uniref:DUF6313 family protein n=1 Tax=Couchioplanes caeruleus TaxID=56438 RepID=UPI0020C089AE|nr:DUF6313 family protein [Couchioplanes caeruleus]UQU64695.1 DUF6313 family protein [Couchioplanes caeruleus]